MAGQLNRTVIPRGALNLLPRTAAGPAGEECLDYAGQGHHLGTGFDGERDAQVPVIAAGAVAEPKEE